MYLAIIFSVLLFIKSIDILSVLKLKTKSSKIKTQPVVRVSLLNFIKHVVLNKFDPRKFLPSLIEIYGSSFEINVFGFYNFVFVTDPKILQKLFMSAKAGHVEKPTVYRKIFSGPTENGLITSHANIWSAHRSTISKAFTYKGLMCQVQVFEDKAKKMIFDLENNLTSTSSDGSEKILSRLIQKSAFDAACSLVTGKTNLLSTEELDRFFQLFQNAKNLRTMVFLKPWLSIDFLWNMHPNSKKSKDIIKEICGICSQMTSKARLLNKSNDIIDDESDMAGKTVLELMIQDGFSNEEIFTEFITMVTTGQETVSQSLNILMFLLAKNKEIQNKCCEEVKTMFDSLSSKNMTEVSMESLVELKYLERCIKEELRLYPTAPIIGRKLETPLILDNNTQLQSGSDVAASSWYIHRNKDIYPDPEKFDPDRFLPENSKCRGICEYMPFSVGPRNCVAWKSAMLEMKMYAAYILYNFEVYVDKGHDVEINTYNITSMPDLKVKFRRR